MHNDNEKETAVPHLRDSASSLREENWALTAFKGAALALVSARSVTDLLQSICESITYKSPFVLVWIGLAQNDSEKTVAVLASAGTAKGYLDDLKVGWDENSQQGQGPTGTCLRTGEPQVMGDSITHNKFGPWKASAADFGIRSSLSIPINGYPDGKAALMIYAIEPHAFADSIIPTFVSLAAEISNGVQRLRLDDHLLREKTERIATQKHLNEVLYQTIRALSLALESRDPYTVGHEERVANIACAIGKKLGWDEFRMQGLRLAALIHDIGKIAVPSEILTKPTRLSSAEMALIRDHSETGYRILKDIPFPWPIARIVHEHHEKLDGSGYPEGLKDNQILLESRILTIADIVESMASNRPYRHALGIDAAFVEIMRLSGKQLDSTLVEICLIIRSETPDVFA